LPTVAKNGVFALPWVAVVGAMRRFRAAGSTLQQIRTFNWFRSRPKNFSNIFLADSGLERRNELFFEMDGRCSSVIAVKRQGTRWKSGAVAPL
jgi:hypothetical protein